MKHLHLDKAFMKATRSEALIAQNGCCHYCCAPLCQLTVTADHKLPRSRGGKDARSNIAAACFDCNQTKGRMTEGQFFSAIKKPPSPDMPFHLMRVWMRRKVFLQTHRSCAKLDKLFLSQPLSDS